MKSFKDATLEINNQPSLNIWDKSVKVEENRYYWNGIPLINKRPISNSKKPRLIELFSGCGGTSVGFEMAGFETVLGADIHKPSVDTFHFNHKRASTILGDLKKVSVEEVKEIIGKTKIDVMIAGVPCQGFSLNNRKRHMNDERNFLFKEYLRFVKGIYPDVAVLENVSGMRSTANGMFVEAIEEEFLKIGYKNITHKLIDAADFGVPQHRKRLIFVATKKGINFEWPKETHGPKGKKRYVTIKDAIGDLPHVEAGEISSSYSSKPSSPFQREMRKNSKLLTNHEAPNHPEDTIKKISQTKPGEPMYPKFPQRIRLKWDGLSPTQVSGGIRPQFQFGHPSVARGLTIRERCRIQSFPDDFVVFGGVVQGRVQTGNAVAPLLAKAIAKNIMKAIKKDKNND